MFPLGSVVFPYTAVPLQVFEPRYQHLLDDVLAADRTFGSVLIERGPEVGGGDQRFDVGTRVKIAKVSRLPEADHRLILVAGTQRIRVERWLGDVPYPRAEVVLYPDEEEVTPTGLVDEVRAEVRRVMALASELGADTSEINVTLPDDPVTASYQAAALTPVTPLDGYSLLSAPGPATRLASCREMLADSARLLSEQLGN
jgi:Lon protease-like protein